MLTDVAGVDELVEGRPKIVTVGGREIAVVAWRGGVYAVRNVCPHQTQPFGEAVVRPRVWGDSLDPGSVRVDDDDPVIVCPVHTWEYSVKSGQCVADPAMRIRSYVIEVRDGRVLIELGR